MYRVSRVAFHPIYCIFLIFSENLRFVVRSKSERITFGLKTKKRFRAKTRKKTFCFRVVRAVDLLTEFRYIPVYHKIWIWRLYKSNVFTQSATDVIERKQKANQVGWTCFLFLSRALRTIYTTLKHSFINAILLFKPRKPWFRNTRRYLYLNDETAISDSETIRERTIFNILRTNPIFQTTLVSFFKTK